MAHGSHADDVTLRSAAPHGDGRAAPSRTMKKQESWSLSSFPRWRVGAMPMTLLSGEDGRALLNEVHDALPEVFRAEAFEHLFVSLDRRFRKRFE